MSLTLASLPVDVLAKRRQDLRDQIAEAQAHLDRLDREFARREHEARRQWEQERLEWAKRPVALRQSILQGLFGPDSFSR